MHRLKFPSSVGNDKQAESRIKIFQGDRAGMKAAFIQFDPLFGDVEGNTAKAVAMVEKTEADVIVLPELFNDGLLDRFSGRGLRPFRARAGRQDHRGPVQRRA